MTSSSLFTELAMALKRTIIPITPYQSQNNKPEPSSTQSNSGLVGTNSASFTKPNKVEQKKIYQKPYSKASKSESIKDIHVEKVENDISLNAYTFEQTSHIQFPEKISVPNTELSVQTMHAIHGNHENANKEKNGGLHTNLEHHTTIQDIDTSLIKPDLSSCKHQPPAIHPDITIEQIRNPRPIQRRKSCFVVGNSDTLASGEVLEINTMFDTQKNWDRNNLISLKSSNPNKRRTKGGRRQSVIVVGNDTPMINTNLIVMQVPSHFKRRKSMPFLNTVILENEVPLLENLSENISLEEVDVSLETFSSTILEENTPIEIDFTQDQGVSNDASNEISQNVEVYSDNKTYIAEKLSLEQNEVHDLLEPTKLVEDETQLKIEDLDTVSSNGSNEYALDLNNPCNAKIDESIDSFYCNIEASCSVSDSVYKEEYKIPRRTVSLSRQRSKMFTRQSSVGKVPMYDGKSISPPCIKITEISSPEISSPEESKEDINRKSPSSYEFREKSFGCPSTSYAHPEMSPVPYKDNEVVEGYSTPIRRRPNFGRQVSLDHRTLAPKKSKAPALQRQATLGGPPPTIRITDVDSESDEVEPNTTLNLSTTPEVKIESPNEIETDNSLSCMVNAYGERHGNQEDPKTLGNDLVGNDPNRKRSSFRRQGSLEQKPRRSVMIIRQKSLDNRSYSGVEDSEPPSNVISIRNPPSTGASYGQSQPLILEFGKGFHRVSAEATLSRINSVASDASLSRMNSVMEPDDVAMMENDENDMENLKTFLQSTKRAPVLCRQRSLDQRNRKAAGMIKQKSLDQRTQPTSGYGSRTDSLHVSPGCSRSGSLATTPEGGVPSFESSLDAPDDQKTVRQQSLDQRPTSPYGSHIPDATMDMSSSHVDEHSPSRRDSMVRQNSGLLIINAASSTQAQQSIGNFLFPTRKTAMMTRQRSLDVRPETKTRSRRPSLCRITRQKSLDQRHSSSRPQSRKSSCQSGKDSVSSGEHSGPSSRRQSGKDYVSSGEQSGPSSRRQSGKDYVSSGEHSGPSSRRQSSKISIGPNTSSSSSAFSSNYSSTSATHGSLSTTTDSFSRKSSAAYGMSGSLSHSRRSSSTRGSSSHLPRQISVASTSSDIIDSRRSSISYGSFASRTCSELRRCSSTDTWSSSSSCLNRSRYAIMH